MDSLSLNPSENEKLLYKLVIQFLIFSQGSHKQLEPHLLQIGKRLRNGANLGQLVPELQSISKTLVHISKQTKQVKQENLNDTVETTEEILASDRPIDQINEYLFKRIDELLDEIGVSPRFQKQATALKRQTRNELTNDSYRSVIDIAVALLVEIKGYAECEQQGLDAFLIGMTRELNLIEQQVEIAGQANRLSIENREYLNTTMNHQLGNIKDATEKAQELSVLKSQTSSHLDSLMQQLIEHKREEDKRQWQAQTQIELMTQKLMDLECETENLRTKLKLEHDKAMNDPLTGLPNRLAYNTRAEFEVNRWNRYKIPLSLAILDIDHFKRINDTYGHKAGDKTLALVGQLISSHCRQTDFAARYGGEEFVILMPSTDAKQALEMAENIRVLIESSGFNYNGEKINLTLSCGISEFMEEDQLDDVFIRADQALYRCKQTGRNCCMIFNSID
ncbi:GGDEF domain-containing protein [Methylomonas sp. AM2-LC]|uniref:GGDEF domain-containing protein n=1 Tax=Methylomonas sp. AM2-LC TaxID=3153301 RepID=UPI0032660808